MDQTWGQYRRRTLENNPFAVVLQRGLTRVTDSLRSVLEELYEASLRVDCDLSKALFCELEPAVATAVWKEAKLSLDAAGQEARLTDSGFDFESVKQRRFGHAEVLRRKLFGAFCYDITHAK